MICFICVIYFSLQKCTADVGHQDRSGLFQGLGATVTGEKSPVDTSERTLVKPDPAQVSSPLERVHDEN